MTTPLYDDSNWREEYKSFARNKMEIELLENGCPKSLSQSWHLQALYSNWKKMQRDIINLTQKKMRDKCNHQ